MTTVRPRDDRAQDRQARIPVDSPQLHLDTPVREGFRRYWFNDVPGRIQSALKGGYDFVTEDTLLGDNPNSNITETDPGGTRVSRVVGTNTDNSARVAYLMEIPEEWYNEDQEKLLSHQKEVMEQIKTGKVTGDEKEDTSNRYGSGITANTVLAR